MKLLVVNLKNPNESNYVDPDNIDVFMWGRGISDYSLFVVDDNGSMKPIILQSSDIKEIKIQVSNEFLKEPIPPKLHVANNIKIEESSYIDELVPILEFKISVSKEVIRDHEILWLKYFKDYNRYNNKDWTTPELEVSNQIIKAFVDKFEYYLNNKFS